MMMNTELDAGFRRREVFRLAATAGIALWAESYAFAASDFWNKKKAAEWTDQEKDEIRTKSPWAKKVDPESSGGRGGGAGGSEGGGDSGGDSGGGGGRGGGGGGGGRGGGRGGGGGLAPQGSFGGAAPLSVVWESAKPIQDAHPLKLPPSLDNHYVIAVTGIPQQAIQAAMRGGGRGFSGGRGGGGRFGGQGGQGGPEGAPPRSENADTAGGPPPGTPPGPPADPTAGLKRGATLTAKGKTVQNSDIVLSTNNNATVLFGFSKEVLSLAVADKEAEFDLKLGGFAAKVKFNLKDMMYGEELAL